jgi:hypothetical protein
MRRPPITITCECGEQRDVPYRDRWVCEQCGRRWNTGQIPAEEYEGLLRRIRRLRIQAFGLALLLAAVFIPLIVFVSARLIFLAVVIAFGWTFLFVPFWRRKLGRAARSAPRWELHPE